jgi:NAD(P)-dependent dehydrogenase (short-subunit alcohol dehydrogenase family)
MTLVADLSPAELPDQFAGVRRNVVVAGASSGISRATALELVRRGYRWFRRVRQTADRNTLRNNAIGSGQIVPIFIDVRR